MTDLALDRPAPVTESAAERFTADQRSLIREAIAPDASETEFQLFLDISGRYGLNPLHGETWLAKMPGKQGGPPKFTVIVGRDGFLSIAQRHPDYRGLRSDVVRAYDTFKVSHGEGLKVTHEYELGIDTYQKDDASENEARNSGEESGQERITRKRGKIVGAWCIVYRAQREPTFFFAPWPEYVPANIERNRAWRTTPSAMIRKVAVSNALREAFNLSGLYSDAEMGRSMGVGDEPPEDTTPNYGDDELGTRLRLLVEEVNRVKPGSWRPAKVRTILATATEEERRALAEGIESEVLAAGGGVPAPFVDAEAEAVPS